MLGHSVSLWTPYIPNILLINLPFADANVNIFSLKFKCSNAFFQRTKLIYIFQWLFITFTSSPNSLCMAHEASHDLSPHSWLPLLSPSSRAPFTLLVYPPCSSHTQGLSLTSHRRAVYQLLAQAVFSPSNTLPTPFSLSSFCSSFEPQLRHHLLQKSS